jgi:hypothetical protein
MKINKTIRNILFPVLIISFSCDKQDLFVTCSDCKVDEPVEVKLNITFDPFQDQMYKPPEINLYENNIEDSLLLRTDTPYSSPIEMTVRINKKYTVTATYYYYGHTVIAVDSATPRVKFESVQCENPCYFVYDKKINLLLKYTK